LSEPSLDKDLGEGQASASVPRLVLLAIILPKMDGYAIARALKAKPAWESMTILMMSRREG